MNNEEYENRIATLELVLEGLLIASRRVGSVAYNIGQAHEQWTDVIYPHIQTLDEWRNRGYKILNENKS